MKTLIVIALVALCGHLGWSRLESPLWGGPDSLRESPYVVVYGRDRCGITQRMRSDLQRSGVPFEYESVDHPGVGDELHPRMEAAGLDTRRYGLPVVDVNGEMLIRPHSQSPHRCQRSIDAPEPEQEPRPQARR
jgi:hypothetical protein